MIRVLAPLSGTVTALASVPDKVFADELVGPGIAIDPTPGTGTMIEVRSPVEGKVAVLHPHAFVIETAAAGVLVHLGIDTVNLHGEPFEVHTEVGAHVSAGDHLVTWDLAGIGALSALVPVVALSVSAIREALEAGTDVATGDGIFAID